MSINSNTDTMNSSSVQPVNLPSVGDTDYVNLVDNFDRMKPFSPEDSSDPFVRSLLRVQPPHLVHFELVQDNQINLDNSISEGSSVSNYSPQNYDYLALEPGCASLLPLGLPTMFPSILLSQGHTASHGFHSPQDDPTLPPSGYIPAHNNYMLPPSFELSSSMTSVEPQGSLFQSLPGCAISPSVSSTQTRSYASRSPSSLNTSFIGRLCTPIKEEDEEEELSSVESQGGLLSSCDISASSAPNSQAGHSPSRTPSSPSTSFIRCLSTLIEEGEEEEAVKESEDGVWCR